MKKFAALFLALVNLAIFSLAAWWLYRNYHSTPVLIANLLIILTGVLISYTIYNRIINDDKNVIKYLDDDFPEIESGLIYAQVADFCNKYDKNKGFLFIVGIDIPDHKFDLQNVKFDKLTDELSFSFSPSLQLKLTGVSTIAVGDEQFMIHGFELCEIQFKGKHELNWTRNKLEIKKVNEETKTIKLPPQKPTIVFDWS